MNGFMWALRLGVLGELQTPLLVPGVEGYVKRNEQIVRQQSKICN